MCQAHGVNADTVAAAVMARIRAAAERPKLHVVRRINERRQRRLEPMPQERDAVQKALLQLWGPPLPQPARRGPSPQHSLARS